MFKLPPSSCLGGGRRYRPSLLKIRPPVVLTHESLSHKTCQNFLFLLQLHWTQLYLFLSLSTPVSYLPSVDYSLTVQQHFTKIKLHYPLMTFPDTFVSWVTRNTMDIVHGIDYLVRASLLEYQINKNQVVKEILIFFTQKMEYDYTKCLDDYNNTSNF